MSETVEWIDPDGNSTTLDTDGDVTDRFMPKIEFEEDGVPGQPGLRLRDTRHGVHEFGIPFWVGAASQIALRTALRAIVKAMDPTRGAGRIRVTAPGGDQREIWCRISGGLGLKEGSGSTGPTDQLVVGVFRAHDPYWYDVSATQTTFSITSVPSFFPWGGTVLFRLTSSEIFADGTVDNLGDVDTWPVWTITGPGGVVTLTNLTTGETTAFTATTLGISETITIDTRPGVKTVTKGDGTNLFPDLSTLSSLWPLVPGANLIRIQMSGADAVTSSVTLSRTHRYVAP